MTALPCAGCSIQDELFASFEQLLALADQNGTTYDRYAAIFRTLTACKSSPQTQQDVSTYSKNSTVVAALLHVTPSS